MRRNPWVAALGTVLLVAASSIGGYFLYQAGYQNGLTETASEVVVQTRPFYPVFPFFFGFIFLFFLFGFIGRMFWWRSWRSGYGPWEHGETSPMERRLSDWHERAHSGAGEGGNRSDTSDTRRE